MDQEGIILKNNQTPENSSSNSNNNNYIFGSGSKKQSQQQQQQQQSEYIDFQQVPLLYNLKNQFKKEQAKINTWTHLFARLDKSISQLYGMCEYEGSQEFVQGVIETLDSAKEDFQKLITKMDIEEAAKDQKKSIAWELSSKSQEIDLNEVENIYRDLEDPENIDFTLLAQLITEQQMSVNEALVLLVRESAIALNESQNMQSGSNGANQGFLGMSNISANNSFISKFSMDIYDVIKDLQDPDQQQQNNDDNNNNVEPQQQQQQIQQQDNYQKQNRSRSNSAGKMNLEQIIKRMKYKFSGQKGEEEEQQKLIKQQLLEKQLKAQSVRQKYQENSKNFLKREKEKGDQIKKKNIDKKINQMKNMQQKLQSASQRQEEIMNQKKMKAKSEIDKIKEIEFITMLEQQNKKLSMDAKLEETRERRKNILMNIQKKQIQRIQKEEQVGKRRIEKNQEKQLKAKSKMIKFEKADYRRGQMLQDEKNKQNLQQSRVKQVVKKVKESNLVNEQQQVKIQMKNVDAKQRIKERLVNDKKFLDNILFNQQQNQSQAQSIISGSRQQKKRNSFKSISAISQTSNVFQQQQQQQQLQILQQQYGESMNSLSDLETLNSDWQSSGDEGENNSFQYYFQQQFKLFQHVSADCSPEVSFHEEDFISDKAIVLYQPGSKKEQQSQDQQENESQNAKKLSSKRNKKSGNNRRKKKDEIRKQATFDENEGEQNYYRQFLSLPPLRISKNGKFRVCKRSWKAQKAQTKQGFLKQRKQFLRQFVKESGLISIKNNNSALRDSGLQKENIRDSFGSDGTQGLQNSNKFQKNKYKNTPTKQQTCQQQSMQKSSGKQLFTRVKSEKDNNNNSSILGQQQQQIKDFEEHVNQVQKEDNLLQNSTLKSSQDENEQIIQQQEQQQQQQQQSQEKIQEEVKEQEKDQQQQVIAKQGDIFRWCSICNQLLQEESQKHIESKTHKKNRTTHSLQQSDDLNCVISFSNFQELTNERFQFLKKRSKKIKTRLTMKGLKHENACIIGKEVKNSENRNRLQKICLDLEKFSNQQLVNYEALMNSFQDVQKVVDQKRESDLHVLRQIRFIPCLMEIFKKVTTVWPKSEINDLVRVLEASCKVLHQFCGQIDNRTYLILTNRPIAIIDLLIWCLNRPTKFVYSLNFVPILFTILIMLLKQRVKPEYQDIQEGIYEYMFYSEFLKKIQEKFYSFYSGIDLSIGKGKVPLALIKSVALLESIANYYSIGILKNQIRHSCNTQAPETIIFVLKETDLCGIVNLIAAILLQSGDITKSNSKILPQTILSLTMIGIKFLNNIARISLELLQVALSSKNNFDQIYHIINLLVSYCHQNYDHSEDVKDLLNEVILLIGYYTLLNNENQDQLCRGTQTIIQKLAGLPTGFFFEKKLKEVLYPTLISISYNNERNSQILFQEINVNLLIQFIQQQQQMFNFVEERQSRLKQEIQQQQKQQVDIDHQDIKNVSNYPNIFKGIFDQNYWSEVSKNSKQNRSISISSNCSSQNSAMITTSNNQFFLFPARFPFQLWSSCVQWIKKIDETLN